MTTTSVHTESHDDHDAHHAKIYLAVLVLLLMLTGITVGASYIDLGPLNIIVALLIATTKASLVGLFFMHLLYDKPINSMALVAGFMFLGLLLSFCLLDIDNRSHTAPTNKTVPKASGILPPEPAVPGAPAPAPPADHP
jgi:cytochrome c oxidase subunit 4